jgi:hypothetical protein
MVFKEDSTQKSLCCLSGPLKKIDNRGVQLVCSNGSDALKTFNGPDVTE